MAEDEERHTCGKGIASNAVLPERMAVLLSAMASIYENHIRALNPAEPPGKQEIEAYTRLSHDYRAAAGSVHALADAMRGYRALPMAEHDIATLMDADSVDAMEALVVAQEELAALVGQRATEFREMLKAMKDA